MQGLQQGEHEGKLICVKNRNATTKNSLKLFLRSFHTSTSLLKED